MQMKNIEKGTVDYSVVNRLRIETVDDFENSLFARQYEEASALISEIIVNNELVEKDFKDMRWLKFEFYNIVPFLGGRGTGKTSAMFSYSTLLRNYKSYLEGKEADVKITYNNADGVNGSNGCCPIIEGADVKLTYKDITGIKKFLLRNMPVSCKVPSFLVLDSVDASMLGNDKGVLEVILAKMWTYYNQELKSGQWDIEVEKQTEIAKLFSDLRQDYQRYLKNSDDKEISNIKQLSNLAGTLNFRATFQKLLKVFLELFSNGSKKYLVLMLDDIDMAGKSIFKVLEQLRLFLCIPNIIILLTADLKRLKQIVGNYYCDVYITDKLGWDRSSVSQSMIRLRDEFVDDYLGKIMPSNMRIFMPDIYVLNPSIIENEKKQTVSEKILRLLFQCGIHFDGTKGRHHFLEEETLRRNANMLHLISENAKKDSQKLDNQLHWLQTNVRGRILDRVTDEILKLKLEKIFHVEIEDLNEYLVRMINNEIVEKLGNLRTRRGYMYLSTAAHFDLGDVLYGCSLLMKQVNDYAAFIDFIIAYYTELYAAYEEKRKYLIKRSIWGDWTNTMIRNLRENMDQYAQYRRDVGMDLKVLKLELDISVERLIEAGCITNHSDFKKDKYVGKAVHNVICKLLEKNKEDVLAFQVLFAFFNNSSYEGEMVRKDKFFEFLWSVHKAPAEKTISLKNLNETKNTGKEQNDKEDNESGTDAAGVQQMYRIVIKPKDGIYARFNIDYPIVDTAFVKNISYVFKQQLYNGIKEQIMSMITEVKSDSRWQNGISNAVANEKRDNKKLRVDSGIFLINKIDSWEKKYPDRNYIFPVENIQMIYNIGKKLENKSVDFSRKQFYTIVRDTYALIERELEKRDNFYEVNIDADSSYVKPYREYPVVSFLLDEKYKEAMQKMFQNIMRDEETTKKVDRGLMNAE